MRGHLLHCHGAWGLQVGWGLLHRVCGFLRFLRGLRLGQNIYGAVCEQGAGADHKPGPCSEHCVKTARPYMTGESMQSVGCARGSSNEASKKLLRDLKKVGIRLSCLATLCDS